MPMQGNMKVLAEEKVKVLAETNRWSPAYAVGYVEGETFRRRGTMPSKYAQIGIDEYSLGFRAAYYERKNPRSIRSVRPAPPAGRTFNIFPKSAHDTL